MNDVWLPLEEACSLMDWTDRWMRANVHAGKVKARQAEVSRNGKPKLEISLESLPAEAQAKWKSEVGSQKSEMKDETAIVVSPTEILIRQEASIAPARIGQLSLLPPAPPANIPRDRWEKACERYRLVEPLLNGDWRRTSFPSKHDYVAWVAKNKGVGYSTVYNWRRRALAIDPAAGTEKRIQGLVDEPRKDKGVSKRPLSEAHKAELRANTIRGLTARACWRFLRNALRSQGMSDKEIPSYRQCLKFCESIPECDIYLARHGGRKLESRHLPYMRLKHDDYRPMELAVLDHTQLDNPVDYFGRGCFPWFTFWLDWHSRYPLGFWLAETPSSRTVAMSTRMMFSFFGVPDEVLTDQGKDIRGRYISGESYRWRRQAAPLWADPAAPGRDPVVLRGVLQSAGVKQIRFSRGRHPQTKGVIERFFRTIKEDFCPQISGWRGNDAKERGETVDPLLREHNAARKRGEASPLIKIEDYAFQLFQWLYGDYARREHSGFEMRGRTPEEAFRPRTPFAGPQADLLLLDRARRKVERCAVEMFNERFEPDPHDAAAIAAFMPHNGHWAEVAYDPHSLVLPDLSQAIATCCGQSYRLQCVQPTSLRGTTEKDYQARLVARARVRKLLTQLGAAHDAAAPGPLTHVPLEPVQPKSESRVTFASTLPIAGADPRYARPLPVRDAPVRRKVFICDAVDEDAALFAEVAGPLPQEER